MSVAQRVDENEVEFDKAQFILNAFGGNALAALRSVVQGAEFLWEQLKMANLCLSGGIAREWKLSFQREG
jgi:hypothetical protein